MLRPTGQGIRCAWLVMAVQMGTDGKLSMLWAPHQAQWGERWGPGNRERPLALAPSFKLPRTTTRPPFICKHRYGR